uniref:Uncharacterized protein n=1 Tax=Strigops habroptila TaxID=2489341 RepID=A0A672VCA5_STRHB
MLLYSQVPVLEQELLIAAHVQGQHAENQSLQGDLALISLLIPSSQHISLFNIPVPKDCQGLIPPASTPAQEKEHHTTSGTSSAHTLRLFIAEAHSSTGTTHRVGIPESSPAQHRSLLQPQLRS